MVSKKSKLLYFSISSLNIDQFLQIFTSRLGTNLLLSGMHITIIMLLHYLVKYQYPSGEFLKYLSKMLNIGVKKYN